MRIAVGAGMAGIALVDAEAPGRMLAEGSVDELPELIARFEAERPRWVWSDTRRWMPRLLAAGRTVTFAHDLRLSGAILQHSRFVEQPGERPAWLRLGPAEPGAAASDAMAAGGTAAHAPTLFGLDELTGLDERMPVDSSDAVAAVPPHGPAAPGEHAGEPSAQAVAEEDRRQRGLVADSAHPRALELLLAAESAGALIAAELAAAGLPWDRASHETVLESELGPRPQPGWKPARMLRLAAEVRDALGAPGLNLDSQVDLLRALRTAGLQVDSTSRWELRELDHSAVPPLLAYKKLARLLSANGWAWLDEWVVDGRFRADYVAGGTATGRWATSGGGALQLPKLVRGAVVADPGWVLVVADAAQLEPRVLAGMSHDAAMAEAGRGRDIYRGIVEAGVVERREEAKIALLGAMYGSTTGDSARLLPRLGRAYPRAMALVDRAAREGERGARVSTLLGRTSPLPSAEWRAVQARAGEVEATAADERRARSSARDWGRFTRNFVVQGTAAEWALCWMAGLRRRLAALGEAHGGPAAPRSGPAFERRPHLVYFLHDELIVHAPAEFADEVAAAVVESAREAGRLLFGDFPVEFPLDLAVVASYGETGD